MRYSGHRAMADLVTIANELSRISIRLAQLADDLKAQVPPDADPMTDLVFEAHNRTGGAAAEAGRAARALEWNRRNS